MSHRAQFAVRKQGSIASGSWSTRTLTVDTDTATATLSRHNHPNNVLYHSMEVKVVQMWPRFVPDVIDDDYNSLKAKLTLRIMGREVPVPFLSADDAAVTNTSSLSSFALANTAAPPGRADGAADDCDPLSTMQTEFSFTAGDSRKKSRPLKQDEESQLYESWMIRFTAIEAYEAAVALLGNLRNPDGSIKKVYGDHVAVDLAAVKEAWAVHHGLKPSAAAAVPLTAQLSMGSVSASGY